MDDRGLTEDAVCEVLDIFVLAEAEEVQHRIKLKNHKDE